jgi:hypothetical protein
LSRAGHFAGATQLKIDFGKPEPIRCGNHRLNPLARYVVQAARCHQNA